MHNCYYFDPALIFTAEKDENGDNIGKFSFNFIVCENPKKLDLTTKEFKTILGDILQILLKEHLERAEQD